MLGHFRPWRRRDRRRERLSARFTQPALPERANQAALVAAIEELFR
jgi:hypothetical protein